MTLPMEIQIDTLAIPFILFILVVRHDNNDNDDDFVDECANIVLKYFSYLSFSVATF